MKFSWDSDNKIMYVYFADSDEIADTTKVDYWPGVNVDFANGDPIGIEFIYVEEMIENAKQGGDRWYEGFE